MRRITVAMLMIFAMLGTTLAGCTRAQAAESESGSAEESGSGTAQTENAAQEQAADDSGSEQETSGSGESAEPSADSDVPVVYMTTDISADGLMAIYEALGASPEGKIAVKLSTGEPGSNYLRTDLIGDLVQSLNGTIVECNTAYGGSRSDTAMHYQVAKDHGYTDIADVDIMDENGSMTLPVTGGSNLTENYVGANFANYDYFVVLSHFKGHAMAGFGGAIKNISIGIASSEGKMNIHTAGQGGSMWGAPQDPFLESMAFDPVAVDQACIDLVYSAEDGQSLINRIGSRNGLHTLEHAESIGLGSRTYRLESIDD